MCPSFSVVVPVYNTDENKLLNCVDSILNQSFKAKEIIIIDDGSEEKCAMYCDRLAKKDHSISVIHKQNNGSAVARNSGIDIATGDYIMFVDSDDVIAYYVLEEAVRILEKYDNLDLIIGLVKKYGEMDYSLLEKKPSNHISEIYISSDDEKNKLMDHMIGNTSNVFSFDQGYVGDGPVARIAKRECLRNARFSTESMCSDDTIWNMRLVKNCNSIVVIDDIWYSYMLCNTSKTRKFRNNSPMEFQYRINQEKKMVEQLWPMCKRGLYIKIWRETTTIGKTFLFHPDNKNSFVQNYTIFKNAISLPVYKEMLKNIVFETEAHPSVDIKKEIVRRITLNGPYLCAYYLWKIICDSMQ